MKRNLYILLSLLALGSMVLAACGAPAATEAPGATQAPATEAPNPGVCAPNEKCAVAAWSQEPDNIVPYYTQMSYAIWIAQMTMIGLGEWDDKGNFVPELAADVPTADNGGVSADGLTITWKLKPDLKWSDGEPLTSADVKFTWQSVVDPANAPLARTGYDKIASIDTPDDTTVVIHFSELYPPWQTIFSQGPNNNGSLLPKHILDGQTGLEKNPFTHQPTVFSGPFMITEWIPGDHMTLEPNPNFYKGQPKLDKLLIKFVPDPETALAALQTGDVDLYPDFSESDIETVGALEPDRKSVV